MKSVKPLTFELRYRKEAQIGTRNKAVRDSDRYNALSDTPAQFNAVKGGYPIVAAAAARLNEAQIRSGFLDYLFFPEVITAPRGEDAALSYE